jgi:hypothetical protein
MTNEPDTPTVEETAVPEDVRDQATTPETEASFGWNAYAERINGRFAMVGFVALLVLEFFTHQDFFTWIGLR